MNKNIKVINDYLWLVDYDLVRAGFIKELQSVKLDGYNSCVTNEGIFLIHFKERNQEVDLTVKMVNYVMGLKDKDLKSDRAFRRFIEERAPDSQAMKWNNQMVQEFIERSNNQSLYNILAYSSKIERQRRNVMKKYKLKKLVGRS